MPEREEDLANKIREIIDTEPYPEGIDIGWAENAWRFPAGTAVISVISRELDIDEKTARRHIVNTIAEHPEEDELEVAIGLGFSRIGDEFGQMLVDETRLLMQERDPSQSMRSREEISARIAELQEKSERYNIRIQTGYSSYPEPESQRIKSIADAQIQILRWVLGEENF